jgi:hypothetical protein
MSIEALDPTLPAAANSVAVAMAPAAVVGLGAVIATRSWRRSPPWSAWSFGLAALAGIFLAAAAMAGGPLAPSLTLPDIFGAGSPWDVTGRALVVERFPEALAGLGDVLRSPLSTLPYPIDWLVRAFILCAVAAVLVPFLGLPLRRAVPTALVAGLVAALTVPAAVYVACFGPWLLNLLNFWALALVLALFCYWRHGTL